MVIFKTKEGIVPANETSILFTDVTINDSSIIEVYFTSDEVYVTAISQEGTSVFITCSQHASAIGVKLFINNVEEFSPYDDTEVKDDIDSLEGDVGNINTTLEGMASDITDLITGKQDKLPTVVNDRYLHTNETTGALEWSVVESSTSASSISYDNTTTGISADNVQDAIDDCFISVSNGKTLIASAITDKGVQTEATDTFQTMATNISNIASGGGFDLLCENANYAYYNASYNITRYTVNYSKPLTVGKKYILVIKSTAPSLPASVITTQVWTASTTPLRLVLTHRSGSKGVLQIYPSYCKGGDGSSDWGLYGYPPQYYQVTIEAIEFPIS